MRAELRDTRGLVGRRRRSLPACSSAATAHPWGDLTRCCTRTPFILRPASCTPVHPTTPHACTPATHPSAPAACPRRSAGRCAGCCARSPCPFLHQTGFMQHGWNAGGPACTLVVCSGMQQPAHTQPVTVTASRLPWKASKREASPEEPPSAGGTSASCSTNWGLRLGL